MLALRLSAEGEAFHGFQIDGKDHRQVIRALVREIQDIADPHGALLDAAQEAVLVGQRVRGRSRAFLVGRVCLLGACLPAGSEEQKQGKGQSKQLFHM